MDKNEERKEKIMKRLGEHWDALENEGYEIVYLALQGSQNYNLDYELSDIDTKAIVLPSLEQIVTNKTDISFTHVMENGEHIDVKDVNSMFNQFMKQNISYLEILFTDFCFVKGEYQDIISILREKAEDVAMINNYAFMNSLKGMAMQKRNALTKRYEGLKDKIDKYGYDGKQAHHLYRILLLVCYRLAMRKPLDYSLDSNNYSDFAQKLLMEFKRNEHSLEFVEKQCDSYLKEIDDYIQKEKEKKEKEVNQETIELLSSLALIIYSRNLKRIVKEMPEVIELDIEKGVIL